MATYLGSQTLSEKEDTMAFNGGHSTLVNDSTTDSADLAARGQAIKRRRMAHGFSEREASELAGVGRATIKNAEAGTASLLKVVQLENWLDQVDESFGMGNEAPEVAIMEIVIEGDFGVRVVVKGPINEPEALERSATRLIAKIREGNRETEV